jgi:hypothetical protein
MKRAFFLVLSFAASVSGQATFDLSAPPCGATFPVGCGALGDPEGISWNGVAGGGLLFGATVDAVPNGLGFPCGGPQYGRVPCAQVPVTIGTGSPPPGGPAPAAAGVDQMYIPIPGGSAFVSFCWDFYNEEGFSAAPTYNDGVAIELVGAGCGASLATLAYADCSSPVVAATDAGGCGAAGTSEVAPAGPQTVVLAPLVAGAAFLRVKSWNSGDNTVSSHAVIDEVVFTAGVLPCSLSFTSPAGPGSVAMANTACAAMAGANYLSPITLVPGAFPGGWFFGLDITITELLGQYSAGFPFAGLLDATGASFAGPFGPAPVLSGVTLYGVTAQFTAGFGSFLGARAPVSYTIP